MTNELTLLNEYADSTNVGVLIASTLFGVFILQLHNYTGGNAASSDRLALRLLVAWVALCEIAHTVLLWVYYIPLLRASRFSVLHLLDLPPSLGFAHWLGSIMGMTVQSFYGYRIYHLSGKLYLSILPWIGSVLRGGLATLALVESFRTSSILVYTTQYGWSLQAVYGTSVAVDLLTCIILCTILYGQRGDQAITKRIIDKLLIWTIETGLATTILAIMMLSCMLINRYSLAGGMMHVYPNLFSLSFMISLNARGNMRSALENLRQASSITVSGGRLSSSAAFALSRSKSNRRVPIALQSMQRPTQIEVHTERFEHVGESPTSRMGPTSSVVEKGIAFDMFSYDSRTPP